MSLCTKCGEGYKLLECVRRNSVHIFGRIERLCERCTFARNKKLQEAISLIEQNQSFANVKIIPIDGPTVNIDKLVVIKGVHLS